MHIYIDIYIYIYIYILHCLYSLNKFFILSDFRILFCKIIYIAYQIDSEMILIYKSYS